MSRRKDKRMMGRALELARLNQLKSEHSFNRHFKIYI